MDSSFQALVNVIVLAVGFKPSTKILDELVSLIRQSTDKTVVAKTRDGVRRIISTELANTLLKSDRTFIEFNCRSCEEL